MTATLAFTAGTAFGIVLTLVLWKRTERHGREWWLTDNGDDAWDSERAASDWVSRYPEDGPVIHVRDVLPETN